MCDLLTDPASAGREALRPRVEVGNSRRLDNVTFRRHNVAHVDVALRRRERQRDHVCERYVFDTWPQHAMNSELRVRAASVQRGQT